MVTSFSPSAHIYNTHTQTQNHSWSPFLHVHGSKRSLSQSRRSKSLMTRGRVKNSVDLLHRNGFLTSLHNNFCTQTQAHFHIPVYTLHHNPHLSHMHNSRPVIRHLCQPPQRCLLGPRCFNGPLMCAWRDSQRRTRLVQNGNSVGTWEKHGQSVAHLVLQHNKF